MQASKLNVIASCNLAYETHHWKIVLLILSGSNLTGRIIWKPKDGYERWHMIREKNGATWLQKQDKSGFHYDKKAQV